VPDRVVNAAWPPRHIDLDQRGLNWLTTVATREAWRQGSTARELPAGAFIAAALATGAGELPEPAGPAGDPADLALARDEHTQRVGQLQALKPREREALYLQGLGHSYHAIAVISRGTVSRSTPRFRYTLMTCRRQPVADGRRFASSSVSHSV
jgi:DNA-directed RNA polymerase specialized sigma24 family protein